METQVAAAPAATRVLRIGCAVVGERSVFSVQIQEREIVDEFKKRVKAAKPNLIQCDADELTPLMARKQRNTSRKKPRTETGRSHHQNEWLRDDDRDLDALLDGHDRKIFEAYAEQSMRPLWGLDRFFDFMQQTSDT